MRTAPRASIDCTDTEPIARCRARCRAVRRALIERLHGSRDRSKSQIKPEPRYQHVTVTVTVTVTESKQSNVVKLEPSAGPTLFLIRTTTDRSTTVTAIRIQYCASCTARTDTAARKGPIQGQQHNIRKQAPRNGKAVYEGDTDKETLQEIVHRARLTTLCPSYPHATEDRTEPYLAKLVKDLVKDYKEQELDVRSQRFSSEIVFTKGCTADARAKDMQRR